MSKKIALFAILLTCIPAFSYAIGSYKVGATLYNHASSGLILRKTASPEGARITAIAYGEAVTVIKNDQAKKAHQVTEFPGYKIKGFWVKVKNKDGQEGFVFDGYLSAYPVMGELADDQQGEESSCIAEIFLLGKTAKKGARINLAKTETQYENYRQLFQNGAVVVFTGGEGGSAQAITFEKGITMEEAYLIGKGVWLKDMKVKPVINKNGSLVVNSEDELWQITVENKGGLILLTMSHAD
jgi:hypothetical protein